MKTNLLAIVVSVLLVLSVVPVQAQINNDAFSSAEIATSNYLEARSQVKKGDFDGAIDSCSRAIAHDPSFGLAYGVRGYLKLKRGDYREALTDYDILVRLKPHWTWSYVYRGCARQQLGLYDLAVKDYDTALYLDPHNLEALSSRSIITNSGADYDYLISVAPRWAPGYSHRACWKANRGDCRGAVADYSKAIELGSKDSFDFHGRACNLLDLGQLHSALSDINSAITMDPSNCWHYFVLGRIQIASHTFREAVASFDRAIPALNHCSSMAYKYRGQAKLATGDWSGLLDFGTAFRDDACSELDRQIFCLNNYALTSYARTLLSYLWRLTDQSNFVTAARDKVPSARQLYKLHAIESYIQNIADQLSKFNVRCRIA